MTANGTASKIVPQDEARARRALRQKRILATGLLLGMLLLFIATSRIENPSFLLSLIKAAAEAGIVGGMADWFAVTALFRHPLRLPIPHTAILPKNKDRIGRALGRFIEQSFLSPEALLPRLRQERPGHRFVTWLATPAAAQMVAHSVVTSLPQILRSLEASEFRDFIGRTLGEQFRAADLSAPIGRTLHVLTASRHSDVLFERAVDVALRWLEEHRQQFDEAVRARSSWWIPKTVDRRIANAIAQGASDLLEQLRQPDSEARNRFREALRNLIDELMESPEQRERLHALKNDLLEHPDVEEWLGSVWSEVSRLIVQDAAQPDSRTRTAIEKAVHSIGQALAADQAMQERIDHFLEDLARKVIERRGAIGGFVADVVESWDANTLSDRLELVIGGDLQYIRMNGTVVGALVGAVIFLGTSLAG